MATVKGVKVAAYDSGLRGKAHASQDIVDTFTATAVLALNDVLILGRIGMEDTIESILLFSDDQGTGGLLDVGFHLIDGLNGLGAAIDADAIGTSIDVKTAALSASEIRFETKGINTLNQKVWELAGLSARPDYGECFITATAVEATTNASGKFAWRIKVRGNHD